MIVLTIKSKEIVGKLEWSISNTDIIDMIKRTCTKIMMEKIHKINYVVSKRTPCPFIELRLKCKTVLIKNKFH